MKQTAVEWLEKRFYFTKGQLIDIDFNQAKEMEKQQIEDAYVDGGEKGFNKFGENFEQYYNETFKSE